MKKVLASVALILAFTSFLYAKDNKQKADDKGVSVEMAIQNISIDGGHIIIEASSNEDAYQGKKKPDFVFSFSPKDVVKNTANGNFTTKVTFNVPKGDYAFVVYQDDNGNKELDLENERKGFSNKFVGKFRQKPDFHHTKIKVEPSYDVLDSHSTDIGEQMRDVEKVRVAKPFGLSITLK